MEQWVKEWRKEQRDQGVKCLEVKMQGKSHYVYHSTTYWDKALKKPRKNSKYLGMLDPDKGLIKSGGRHRIHPSDIRNITEYGNSMLLHETMKELKPLLKEGFSDCWAEICAIAMVRVTGNVPLKRIKDAWEKLYNAENMRPQLNPKNISRVMREVGVNRAGQNVIFKELAPERSSFSRIWMLRNMKYMNSIRNAKRLRRCLIHTKKRCLILIKYTYKMMRASSDMYSYHFYLSTFTVNWSSS